MNSMKPMRRMGLVLLLCLAVFAPMTNGIGAPKATIGVTATPTSASTVNGGSVTYTVTVTTANLNGTVSMSASGMPAQATATFTPSSFNATSANPNKTVTLTVATAAATPTGTSTIKIQASGGGVVASTNVTLNVCTYSIGASPSSTKIGAGSSATYAVTIARCPGFTSAVSLSVSGLPGGSTATFSPASTTGTSASLVVTTSASTPSGSFTLTIRGTSGALSSTTTVGLSVDAANGGGKSPFTISGAMSGLLAPGVARSMDLTFTNPNNQDLTVNSLSVSITSTSNPTGCPTSNYSVTQFTGSYSGLVVPHNGTASLSGLGIPQSQWPRLAMLNTNQNQNACKGATVNLAYTGTGSGN